MLAKTVVLITGASRGIGLATALAFAKKGAYLVLNYRSEFSQQAKEMLEKEQAEFRLFQADVSDPEEAASLCQFAKEQWGRIDILVNNAGITKDQLIIRMSEEDFDGVVKSNLSSTFYMIRHVAPVMLKQKKGSIINLSSVIGLCGNIGQSSYAASKAGIIGLTKSVAKELASRNITCNAIAPGFVQTDMTNTLDEAMKEKILTTIPLRRFAQKEEIANFICALANTSYITGQTIAIDGGLAM